MVGNNRVPVLGHVGMGHTVVDITNVECAVGEKVQFDINPVYVGTNVERRYV